VAGVRTQAAPAGGAGRAGAGRTQGGRGRALDADVTMTPADVSNSFQNELDHRRATGRALRRAAVGPAPMCAVVPRLLYGLYAPARAPDFALRRLRLSPLLTRSPRGANQRPWQGAAPGEGTDVAHE